MWCLQDVDYSYINPARYDDLHPDGNAKVLAKSKPPKPQPPSRDRRPPVIEPATALGSLREALLFPDLHKHVPSIIANWPLPDLRLTDVLKAEEVATRIGSQEQLWSWVFQGVATRTARCRLTKLDLTTFQAGDGLVYLLTAVVPLLTLPPEMLRTQTLIEILLENLGDEVIPFSKPLQSYLDVVLNHKVFQKNRRIVLQQGTSLSIVLDFFPLSGQGLTHLSLLTALGLSDITRVNIIPNTAIVKLQVTNGNCQSDKPGSLHVLKFLSKGKQAPAGLCFEDLYEHCQLKEIWSVLENNVDLSFIRLAGALHEPGSHFNIQSHALGLGLLKHFNKLSRLELCSLDLSGVLDTLLNNLPSLSFLGLPYCRLSHQDLKALSNWEHCTKIRDLDLRHIRLMDQSEKDDDFVLNDVVKACDALVVLNLSSFPTLQYHMDLFISVLEKMKKLQILVIAHVTLEPDDTMKLLNACVIHLSGLRRLELTLKTENVSNTDTVEVFDKIKDISKSTKLNIKLKLANVES